MRGPGSQWAAQVGQPGGHRARRASSVGGRGDRQPRPGAQRSSAGDPGAPQVSAEPGRRHGAPSAPNERDGDHRRQHLPDPGAPARPAAGGTARPRASGVQPGSASRLRVPPSGGTRPGLRIPRAAPPPPARSPLSAAPLRRRPASLGSPLAPYLHAPPRAPLRLRSAPPLPERRAARPPPPLGSARPGPALRPANGTAPGPARHSAPRQRQRLGLAPGARRPAAARWGRGGRRCPAGRDGAPSAVTPGGEQLALLPRRVPHPCRVEGLVAGSPAHGGALELGDLQGPLRPKPCYDSVYRTLCTGFVCLFVSIQLCDNLQQRHSDTEPGMCLMCSVMSYQLLPSPCDGMS